MTLGEGIDAIINQEYLSEGRGNSNRGTAAAPVAASSSGAKAASAGADQPNEDGAEPKNSPIHHNWKVKALKRPNDPRSLSHDGQPILVDLVDPASPANKIMRRAPPSPTAVKDGTGSGHYESISPPPSSKGLGTAAAASAAHLHNPASTPSSSGFSFTASAVSPHASKPPETSK